MTKLLMLALLVPGLAASGAPAQGSVDWPAGMIRATGSGAPDLKAANPAQARLAAEKAAQLDAFRNLLSQVKGVQISSGQTVSDLMGESDEVRARVEGTLRGFRVVKKRYFSDSGVELDVEVPLAQLTELLPAAPSVTPEKPGSGKYSAVIVDAAALKPSPALSPRLLDVKGASVFTADLVSPRSRADGVAHYARTLEDARKSPWAGEHPLIVKALKADGPDLTLSDTEAHAVLTANECLREGHVIIVSPALSP